MITILFSQSLFFFILICDCFALVRARQHAITTYNVHMVDMDNHRPGPGRQMIALLWHILVPRGDRSWSQITGNKKFKILFALYIQYSSLRTTGPCTKGVYME